MKEDQRTEFKRNWRDEFLKELCAFANSQGGTLYIGVEDDGTVVGISDAKALLENMPNKVLSNLGILANVELMASDGKEYVSVRVEGQDNPVSYGGKFYVRTGSTTQELRGRELARFLQQKMDIEWDALTQRDATMDDIDEKAVKYFVEKAIEEKRIDESVRYEDKGTVLEKLGLIAANGELTNAALLLFGKDVERWYPTAIFRIGRFGASQADLIMHDNIACALIEMPKNVIGMLRNKYLIARNGYEGLSRREPLEIPEDGLREMLCNAIIHKDYTSTYIQMRVWDKEVELWNPGPLPEELTVASLMEKHASMPRNPKIAKVFFLAGFIESWGRGYERIRESFDKAHLAMPKFEQVHGGFMATIQREVFMRVQGGSGETESDSVSNSVSNSVSDSVSGGSKSAVSWQQVVESYSLSPTLTWEVIEPILRQMQIPHLLKEIINALGYNDPYYFKKTFINPLLNAGIVAMSNPKKPRDSKQKYVLTEDGKRLIE